MFKLLSISLFVAPSPYNVNYRRA